MSDLITLIVRTLAQTTAGAVITWLATSGYDVDSSEVVATLFVLFSAGWAAATTWLAANVHPAFGLLSILPASPNYDDRR